MNLLTSRFGKFCGVLIFLGVLAMSCQRSNENPTAASPSAANSSQQPASVIPTPTDGPYEDRYPGGGVAQQGFYSNGKKSGHWVLFYSGGTKQAEGDYVNGIKEGTWKRFDDKGNVFETVIYKGGLLEGVATEYLGGKRTEEMTLAANKNEGPCKKWYADGTLKMEGMYHNGLPSDHWVFYRANGKKEREGDYLDGLQHGKWIDYDQEGRPTTERVFERDIEKSKRELALKK